jgi:hypothetical protein
MDEILLDTARMVRGYLADLVDEDLARDLDRQIARLLATANNGEDVTEPLRRLLSSVDIIQAWADDVRRDPQHRPPELQPGRGPSGYTPQAGAGEPIIAQLFACPFADFRWYRREIGQPVRSCPTHGAVLVPA